MKIKQMTKFLFGSSYTSYLIYLGAMVVLVHIFIIFAELTDNPGIIGGIETATIIYLYILGISVFKKGFLMGIQNGISRKTFFWSIIIFIILFSAVASLGDTLISVLCNFYENHISHNFVISSTYQQLYVRAKYAADDITFTIGEIGPQNISIPFSNFVKQFFFQMSGNILAFSIAMLVKRLNIWARAFLFVSLYLIFFAFTPSLDSISNYKIRVFVNNFISWIMHSSWNFSLLYISISVICLAVFFILIRRYNVEGKNK